MAPPAGSVSLNRPALTAVPTAGAMICFNVGGLRENACRPAILMDARVLTPAQAIHTVLMGLPTAMRKDQIAAARIAARALG